MEVESRGNTLDRRKTKTMTMNWEGLGEFEDDDDRFFETYDRLSSAMSLDMAASSSDEEEDFDDQRLSFSSAVSSFTTVSNASRKFRVPVMSADYDIWLAAPGSISERRRRLLHGMGLASNKSLLRAVSIQRAASNKSMVSNGDHKEKHGGLEINGDNHCEQEAHHAHLVPVLLVRSRSESDIEKFSIEKLRKEELLGKVSKQRLTKTTSGIAASQARLCQNQTVARASPMVARNKRSPGFHGSTTLASIMSDSRFGAFFLIKNLDTGKEFIVNEYDEDGMWNRLSDLQTGKQLSLEEFEKCVGYSPVVKELMRRENVSRVNYESVVDLRKFNSYLSKSLRLSKRRGVALLKNIKDVAHSMSLRVNDKDGTESSTNSPRKSTDNKHGKVNQWVKVRLTGKSYKELSALHMCQEIQAHEGAIWTIKFSADARYLASAGEDRVIHVWEVQECEIMSLNEGSLTPIHPSLSDSMDRLPSVSETSIIQSENKKKGKSSSGRRGSQIPEYVHVPETVFSFSEKPICSFKGHLDDILDLSWSKSQLLLSSSMDKTVRLWDFETRSCLKLFAHNDYVTCIQFNPMNENYFLSGSLDAKVRIWNISDRHVVEWSDLHEMVTAACYTPNCQGALIGSHKGICRVYNTKDGKLSQTNQIDVQSSKKSQAKKKITGLQFSPMNPSEVLVTSADSRIRMVDGSTVIHKFKGFRNTNSQISASYSIDGKYIICASEDSHVYLWRREDHRTNTSTGKRTMSTTQSHEHFQCKDVSVAIPWHGHVRGEPPLAPMHSKRHSKRIFATAAIAQLSSATSSPTKQELSAKMSTAYNKKAELPPLPKKIVTQTLADEEIGQTTVSEPGYESSRTNSLSSLTRNGYDSNSERVSSRFGDSPSINTSSRTASWSWLDGASHGAQTVQPTAWGMVIVTATIGGEIRAYQNFGLPRRIGRQATFF